MNKLRKSRWARPVFSSRKLVHMSMLGFAFLLPFLTWVQAAGAAVLALLFNVFILPSLRVDLRKRSAAGDAALTISSGQAASGSARQGSENIWTGIVLYPISVLCLILLYRHSLEVVGAVWAIMALGDAMASVAGEALRGQALPYNPEKTWPGFWAFVVAGTLGAYVLTRWGNPSISPGQAFVVCLLGSLLGAMVESLPIGVDDNLSVPLVCGGFIFCALMVQSSSFYSNLPYLKVRMVLAVVINLLLAMAAWRLRLVDRSGALAGWMLGTAIYLGYGYKSFLLLLAFFALGSAATRLGYAQKAARGVAERRRGARSWREAAANTSVAAFFALLVITTPHEAAFLLALVASLAEAAGDTVSSEIGQWLSPRAYLITTLDPVAAGENGGVSWTGTVAGLAASTAVVGLGYGLGLCSRGGAALALGAALAGNLLDSLLGATLERQGRVTNAIVNFAGTSFAGGLALGLRL